MENFIIAAVLSVIIGAVAFYLIRSKKRGRGCIGCPCSKQCSGGCGSMHKKGNNGIKENGADDHK